LIDETKKKLQSNNNNIKKKLFEREGG